MKENKSTGAIIVIIMLIIIILGLVGYIAYDKGVFNTKKEKTVTTEKKVEKDEFKITYKEDIYEAKDSSGVVKLRNKRNIPTVTSKTKKDIADKITANINDDESEKWWNDLKEEYGTTENLDNTPYVIGISFLYSTVRVTDSYISLQAEQSGGMGGVSWGETLGYVYSTTTGEELKVTDIGENETEFKAFINDYALDYLENSSYSCLNENWKSEFNKYLFDNFNLDDDGINIYISRYSIACGADGTVIVKIPYSDVNSYLKTEYQEK